MLTGRSAVHRHTDRQTDRQTNSGKNKGPSGFSQIGPTDGKPENKGSLATTQQTNKKKMLCRTRHLQNP